MDLKLGRVESCGGGSDSGLRYFTHEDPHLRSGKWKVSRLGSVGGESGSERSLRVLAASEEAWEGCEKAERNARWKSGAHADSRTLQVYEAAAKSYKRQPFCSRRVDRMWG